MNQLAFALGALAGVLCAAVGSAAALLLLFGRRRGQPLREDATYKAAFEQWPTTALVLDPVTLRNHRGEPGRPAQLGLHAGGAAQPELRRVVQAEGMDSQALLEKLRDAPPRTYIEMRQRCKDGSQRTVEAAATRSRWASVRCWRSRCTTSPCDARSRRSCCEKHQQLDHLAHHDQLTGLPNRLLSARRTCPRRSRRRSAAGSVLAVLFLDLDRFKHVNDSRGHETGDKLLKTVAQRIRSTMRAEDVVVRMGGRRVRRGAEGRAEHRSR